MLPLGDSLAKLPDSRDGSGRYISKLLSVKEITQSIRSLHSTINILQLAPRFYFR
jgi:hypothetical protein